MPDIDVPAIIDAAAAADCDRSYPYAMAHAAKVLPGIAEALYAPILALHNPADNDAAHTPICPDCKGLAGVHPCGCWTDTDRQPVCGHCNGGDHRFQSIAYPCPTVLKILEVLNGLA